MINNIENSKSKNKKEEEKNSDLNQNINTIRYSNKDYIQPCLTSNSNYNKNNFLTSPIEKNIDISEYFLNQNENELQEENFPSYFIGNVMQINKLFFFSSYSYPYIELQTEKKELRKYKNVNDYYNKKYINIIKIKNIKNIEKLPNNKNNDYVIKISYFNNDNKLSNEIILTHHSNSQNEWYENLNRILNSEIPKINNNFIKIIDDQTGIVQIINKNQTNEKNIKKISVKDFQFLSLLGKGEFSTVFKVYHKETENFYAMKVINKNSSIKKNYLHYIIREYEILKELSNFPFILNLHFCFQSANYLFMVLDLCDGGDFTNVKKIENKKIFFAELILAFEYMHKKGIIYRDLKPENILLDSEGHIKICDFNLAKKNRKKTRAKSFCGSPLYLTPEMYSGKGVTFKHDIYQIGLIIYELNTFIPAFNTSDLKTLYDKVKNNEINFNLPQIKYDRNLFDLLMKILDKDEEKRLNINEIKKHEYFKEIDWNKILMKKSGKIKIWNGKKLFGANENVDEYEKFKEEQNELNKNNEFSYLDGKISVKELYKDLKRKNNKFFINEFFYDENLDENKIKFSNFLSKIQSWNNDNNDEEVKNDVEINNNDNNNFNNNNNDNDNNKIDNNSK